MYVVCINGNSSKKKKKKKTKELIIECRIVCISNNSYQYSLLIKEGNIGVYQ